MRRGQSLGLLEHLGVGALVWEGVVHPLREEPAVQRHLALVVVRDVLKPARQALGQFAGRVHSGGGDVAHELQQVRGVGDRRLHLGLQLVEKAFALAEAADGVVRRRGDAVGGPLQVVGDPHLLLPATLVQGADLPQVLH